MSITASSAKAEGSRCSCDGCEPIDNDDMPSIADYAIRGEDFSVMLCDECALKVVKSLSAIMTLSQPSMKRRLAEFFGTAKKRRAA